MIVGIVLLFLPNMTMALLGSISGIGLLVTGITHIVIYFTKDHLASILHMDLTVGVVCGALGAFILMHADFVELAIPFAIGIILLIGSMTKLQYSLDMKRMGLTVWKVILCFSLLMLILGIVFIYNPFVEKVLVYMIAVSLMLDGILNIVCILLISHRLKKIARGQAVMPYDRKNVFHAEAAPGAQSPAPSPESGIIDAQEDELKPPAKY